MHHASKTFVMDEELGCARVRVQYGDDEQKLEVSDSFFLLTGKLHLLVLMLRSIKNRSTASDNLMDKDVEVRRPILLYTSSPIIVPFFSI